MVKIGSRTISSDAFAEPLLTGQALPGGGRRQQLIVKPPCRHRLFASGLAAPNRQAGRSAARIRRAVSVNPTAAVMRHLSVARCRFNPALVGIDCRT
jgi:hypothetical protein